MKPLHSSTWRTESDCGVLVDVAEGRTTEWAPFREIVVTMDAGMTPAEARRLIADLQHAVALAEEDDQPKPRVWHKGDPEPIESGLQLRSDDGLTWFRKPNGEWKNDAAWGALWPAVLHYAGELSEVLADSEQVTR